jgi:hypothetical protein
MPLPVSSFGLFSSPFLFLLLLHTIDFNFYVIARRGTIGIAPGTFTPAEGCPRLKSVLVWTKTLKFVSFSA